MSRIDYYYYFVVFWIGITITLGCSNSEKPINPAISPLTQSVYASLEIVPKNQYNAYSPVIGIIENLIVDEGQLIKKDQVLAKIKNENLSINTKTAVLDLELSQENLSGNFAILKTIKSEIQEAKLKLNTDSINYARQKNLWDQNIGSKSALDNLKLQYDLSKSHIIQLKHKYLTTQNELSTIVKLNQLRLKSAHTNKEDFIIRSKIDGRIYALYKEEGELIQLQEPLATIGLSDSFLINMHVDEVDITSISPGQKTIVYLDAYPGQVFDAMVTKIYPQKNIKTQTFKVEATFKQQPNSLYPGLSGEANIIIISKEKVITIPRSYLSEKNTVFTENGEVTVTVGIKSIERIEIITGLDTTMTLLKPESID